MDNHVVLRYSLSIFPIRLSIFPIDSQSFWHKISSMDLYPPLPFNPSFDPFFNFSYVASIFSKKISTNLFLLRVANYNRLGQLSSSRVCVVISEALAFYAICTQSVEKSYNHAVGELFEKKISVIETHIFTFRMYLFM